MSLGWTAAPLRIGPTLAAGRDAPPAYTLRDLLTFAWHGRHIWLPLTAIGLALGCVAEAVWPRHPSASAVFLALGADDATLRSELSIAGSDVIARAVVDRIGAQRLLDTARLPAPLDRLQPACPDAVACATTLVRAQLSERPDNAAGGSALRLTALAATPDMAVEMLQAAIPAMQALRRTAFATARGDALAPQLAEAQSALAAIRAEAGRLRASAGVLEIGQDVTVTAAAAATLRQRDAGLAERQGAVQAELARARLLLPETPERQAYSRETSSRDTGDDSRAALLQLRLERAHLAALYAPTYPGLAELDRKIEITARPQPRSVSSVAQDRRNPIFDHLTDKVAALQVEGDALAAQRAELARQTAAMDGRVAALGLVATRLGALAQQETMQQDVARKLSVELADLRAKDALAAARTEELRVLQPPSPDPAPLWPHRADPALGGLAGLLVGLAGTIVATRRRPVYVAAREAERDLALPELAELSLWRKGADHGLTDQLAHALTTRVFDTTTAEGAPVATIHLIGTAEQDGSELIARALADSLQAGRNARVLVVRLHRDGRGDIQGIPIASPAQAPSRQSRQALSVPNARLATASAANIVCALFGDITAVEPALSMQLARLRAMHDVVLVLSDHGTAPAVTRRLSALADQDVLIVRARRSRAQTVRRLRDLAATGGRLPGFVFTRDRGTLLAGRTE